MDGMYSGVKLIAGNSNISLAREISEFMEVELCDAKWYAFPTAKLALTSMKQFEDQMSLSFSQPVRQSMKI